MKAKKENNFSAAQGTAAKVMARAARMNGISGDILLNPADVEHLAACITAVMKYERYQKISNPAVKDAIRDRIAQRLLEQCGNDLTLDNNGAVVFPKGYLDNDKSIQSEINLALFDLGLSHTLSQAYMSPATGAAVYIPGSGPTIMTSMSSKFGSSLDATTRQILSQVIELHEKENNQGLKTTRNFDDSYVKSLSQALEPHMTRYKSLSDVEKADFRTKIANQLYQESKVMPNTSFARRVERDTYDTYGERGRPKLEDQNEYKKLSEKGLQFNTTQTTQQLYGHGDRTPFTQITYDSVNFPDDFKSPKILTNFVNTAVTLGHGAGEYGVKGKEKDKGPVPVGVHYDFGNKGKEKDKPEKVKPPEVHMPPEEHFPPEVHTPPEKAQDFKAYKENFKTQVNPDSFENLATRIVKDLYKDTNRANLIVTVITQALNNNFDQKKYSQLDATGKMVFQDIIKQAYENKKIEIEHTFSPKVIQAEEARQGSNAKPYLKAYIETELGKEMKKVAAEAFNDLLVEPQSGMSYS